MPKAFSKGDRFRLTRDWRGQGATQWKSRSHGEFRCVVPKGTVVVSRQDVDRMAVGFVCAPESYEALEHALVPEDDRTDPDYDGYTFIFFVGDVGALLEKLEEDEPS